MRRARLELEGSRWYLGYMVARLRDWIRPQGEVEPLTTVPVKVLA